jgi:hypothetical protein
MLAEHAQTSQHDSCWSAIGPMRDLRAGSRITATRNTVFDPWSTPINLGALVNSVSLDFDPHIGSSGEALYFASTRDGGFGGQDCRRERRNFRKPSLTSRPARRILMIVSMHSSDPCLQAFHTRESDAHRYEFDGPRRRVSRSLIVSHTKFLSKNLL